MLPCLRLFDVTVNLVLDKDLLQAREVPLFLKLVELYAEFGPQQVQGMLRGTLEQVGHPGKQRLVVLNHTAQGRNRHFTGRESVEGVHRLVRRNTGHQMQHNLHVLGRVVLDLLDLDLALVVGFDDGVNDTGRSRSKRNLRDDERLLVVYGNLGAATDATAAFTVVVLREIGNAPRRKIREDLHLAAAEVRNGGINELNKVVRKHLGRKTHRNTLHALGQEKRKLHGQRHRLLGSAVVAGLPFGDFRVEGNLQGKLAQPRFDVTRSCG